MKWHNTAGLIAVSSVTLGVLGAALYPLVHNRYLHPVGQLYGTIRVGDPCTDVRAAFLKYHEHRRLNGVTQLATYSTEEALLKTEPVAPSKALHLYDESLFDDVQLTVRCDPANLVAAVQFIGD